jgi:2-polyprenyl-6-methoxyphenol hydroxylase-like FAD-dependent oxidoreductase
MGSRLGDRTAVVIGASLAGLFAAAAAARSGYAVTLLERDRLAEDPTARKGVPQGAQVHVLLHRGWLAAEELLPGLRGELLALGAPHFSSGSIHWLDEHGWLPSDRPGYELVCCSRPLLELLVRRRVRQLPGVALRSGSTVSGLDRQGDSWIVVTLGGADRLTCDLVIDASGRNSRLPHWLGRLGCEVPAPDVVDARLGYATRSYRARVPLPLRTGVVVIATPESPAGGLALPVENGHWLIMGGGYGDRRPPRDAAGFEAFLAGLRDPVLADLAARLEPIGAVAVHRQTGNRRYRFEEMPDWPDGLLAVGDSVAAFNPIYGQGISVAAAQAQRLRDSLRLEDRPGRRLQRRIAAIADLPWTIATGADLRIPTIDHSPSLEERLLFGWSERLAQSAIAGDPVAATVFAQLYHLMAPTSILFHPLLAGGVLRSFLTPRRALPRPAILDTISPQAANSRRST